MVKSTIQSIAQAFSDCAFIRGVVLGGSRATGSATAASDIDIGIYYDHDSIDYGQLNAIARQLDDCHRDSLICQEGGWGKWVNCGGWLTIEGQSVDIILRDWARVEAAVQSADRGEFSCHYQPGHPHAYLDVMYRGELAACKILYARENEFSAAKRRAEEYPPALQKALIDFFLFEANFSCALLEKSLQKSPHGNDVYYLSGHLFRSVSALHQVLFALNRKWMLNEKKAVYRIESFAIAPAGYGSKIDRLFAAVSVSPADTARQLKALCAEVASLLSAHAF